MCITKLLANSGNMDLLCRETVILNDYNQEFIINEIGNTILTACKDPVFLEDRCLENLLKTEEKYTPVNQYFGTVQNDITPPMRKIVAEWMLEVCEERNCQEEVFLLALNYMDRFLATTYIMKTHLQALAAACLLMASKLREPSCRGLPAEILVYYTDNSVSKCDLINWELIVLSRLKWDVSSVTPLDFLELLLSRLPIPHPKCPDIGQLKVRRHAQAFISLAAREHYFSIYSASTIAASSIAAALNDLKWDLRTEKPIRKLLDTLTDLTGIEQEYLSACMKKMEALFEKHRQQLTPNFINSDSDHDQQNEKEKVRVTVDTPTDIQDVKF